MKKLMMLTVAALALGAYADRDVATLRAEARAAYTNGTYDAYRDAMTTAEWRSIADDVLSVASTNAQAAYARWCRVPSLDSAPDAIAMEYDQRFADAGAGPMPPWCYEKWPKATEARIAAPTNAAEVARMSATIALMRKHKGVLKWWGTFSAPEIANLSAEMPTARPAMVDRVLGLVQKDIKRKMREKGLSFVAKDGKNPIQDEVDALSAAFNAPRHAGVKEWFAKWYPEYTWIDSAQDTDAEVAAYKDAVFNGETAFDKIAQSKLRFYLGVEEYNRFVKRYNGEE